MFKSIGAFCVMIFLFIEGFIKTHVFQSPLRLPWRRKPRAGWEEALKHDTQIDEQKEDEIVGTAVNCLTGLKESLDDNSRGYVLFNTSRSCLSCYNCVVLESPERQTAPTIHCGGTCTPQEAVVFGGIGIFVGIKGDSSEYKSKYAWPNRGEGGYCGPSGEFYKEGDPMVIYPPSYKLQPTRKSREEILEDLD